MKISKTPSTAMPQNTSSKIHGSKTLVQKIAREIVMPLLLFLVVAATVLSVVVPVNAQSAQSFLNNIGKDVNLPSYNTNAHANASYESGASNITSAILYAVDFLKYTAGTLAIVVIIISGIRLITAARHVEEVSQKEKENLKYAIIGLMVIIAADQFVKQAVYGEQGEIYRSGAEMKDAAQKGTAQIKGIYNMIEYISAAFAVFMIVVAGIRLVVSAGNEDAQGKSKKQIMWAIVGLIVMGLSEFVVKDIVFPKQGSVLPDTEKAKQLIVNLTNFVSSFVAILSAVMYIYGGYLYVTTFGNEDGSGKAKKVLMGATIGLLLAMAAFAIVYTTVKLEPTSGIQAPGGQ